MMRLRVLTSIFAVAGALGCVVLAGGPARADTPVVLPGGHDHMAAPDGVVIYVDRTGERATISGSMASSSLSRNVWVSGVTSTHVAAPKNIHVTGGTIETGYLLGCQVDLSKGGSAGAGDLGVFGGQGMTPSPYLDPGVTLTLAPGKVVGTKIESFDFKGTHGTTQYVDHTLSIEGCAGYAQARAYTTVTVHDDVMDNSMTLWGKPFSIG